MPRKLISRGCRIFNCDRRHGNFCCYDCGFRTTNGPSRCKNPCQNTPGKCGLDLPGGQRTAREHGPQVDEYFEGRGYTPENLRCGDGFSLEELDYGNDVTDIFVERIESGEFREPPEGEEEKP